MGLAWGPAQLSHCSPAAQAKKTDSVITADLSTGSSHFFQLAGKPCSAIGERYGALQSGNEGAIAAPGLLEQDQSSKIIGECIEFSDHGAVLRAVVPQQSPTQPRNALPRLT